jgi:hypothetical protein
MPSPFPGMNPYFEQGNGNGNGNGDAASIDGAAKLAASPFPLSVQKEKRGQERRNVPFFILVIVRFK